MSRLSGNTKINIGLGMCWSYLKMVYSESIDLLKSSNPLLRVYFDSDLGSPVEKIVEQAYAASMYQYLKSKLPDWELAQKAAKFVGIYLASIASKALDLAKLNYKYFKGQIFLPDYEREYSKRILSATALLVDKGWGFMGKTIKHGIAVTLTTAFHVDPTTAKDLGEKAFIVLSLAKSYIVKQIKSEKAEKLLTKAIQLTSSGITKLYNAGKKAVEVAQTVSSKIANVLEVGVEKVKTFTKKTYQTVAEPIVEKIKGGIKKMWNKIWQ